MPNAPSTMRVVWRSQDDAIERLEHSVQAYQDERARLEAAYKKLASNLGAPELSKDEASNIDAEPDDAPK